MRRILTLLLVGAALLASAGPAAAQEDEGEGDVFVPAETTVPDSVPPTDTTIDPATPQTDTPAPDTVPSEVEETPATLLPAGCPLPPAAHVVFFGVLTAHDELTARFSIDEVVSGSVDGFAADGLVDVVFGDDTKYLDDGERYLVSAGIDDETGKLRSRAKVVLPMFGGDEVVGVNDSDVDCPTYDDPLVSAMSDGSSIDSGVFSPFFERKGSILSAFLKPAAAAFALLVLAVATKRSLWWSMRRSAKAWRRRRATARLAR